MNVDNLTPELIHTKFHRPPVASSVLIRSRLLMQLNDGLSKQLTLICAPAGFGKTTLISSWIESLIADQKEDAPAVKCAWLSLDKGDSDLILFLHCLVGAVQTIFPGTCPKTQEMLRTHTLRSSEELVTVLSNELALLPSSFILVLDDYHTISGEAVHGLLNDLFQRWPNPLHLAVISRSNPPLPLAGLRAKSQVREIRSKDLRFTFEESEKFIDERLSEPISRGAIKILQERTEGWIVGLHLAALSLMTVEDAESAVTNLQVSEAYIADYLTDEVLAQQPPFIQEFLLNISILDRFCLSLCDAVTESPERNYNVRACMEWLERFNLFVVVLDDNKQWYRFHALFRDILQQKLLSEMTSTHIDALHRKAAIWFAQQNLMDEALPHAIASHDFDLLGTLMERALRDVLNREDRPTLERWLHVLPEDFIEQRPALLMIKAWTLQLAWQFDSLNHVLDQLQALLDEAGESRFSAEDLRILRGQILGMQGQAAFFGNNVARTVALCREALSIIPPSWSYVRGGALIYLGLGMQAIGQGRDAEQMLVGSYEALTYKNTSYGLRHLMALCFVNLRDGLLEQVGQTAKVMLPLANESGLMIHQCWAHYFLGLVSYDQNELDTAQHHFEAVIERRHATQILIVNACLYGLVLTHLARGNWDAAWGAWELLSQSDLTLKGRLDEKTRSLRARILMLQGDLEKAANWADTLPSTPPDQPLIWLEEPHLTKVRILLARGNNADVQEALYILDSLFEIAERTFNVYFQIEILALHALAIDMQAGEDSDDALPILQRAVALARLGGFIRIFVDQGPHMHDLLMRLNQQSFATPFINRILAEFPDLDEKTEQLKAKTVVYFSVSEFNDHLTGRELEVLRLLSERLSDKEIAAQLGISTTTVKRHASNIYIKLGVKKRWDAVISAQALGIIPAR